MTLTEAVVRTCPQCLHKRRRPKLLLGPILVALLVAVAAAASVVEVAVEQALNQSTPVTVKTLHL